MSSKGLDGRVADAQDPVVDLEAGLLGGSPRHELADAHDGGHADLPHVVGRGGGGADHHLRLLGPAAEAQLEVPVGAQRDLVEHALPVRLRLAVDGQELVARPQARGLRRRARLHRADDRAVVARGIHAEADHVEGGEDRHGQDPVHHGTGQVHDEALPAGPADEVAAVAARAGVLAQQVVLLSLQLHVAAQRDQGEAGSRCRPT
jgi:hypothetical protein